MKWDGENMKPDGGGWQNGGWDLLYNIHIISLLQRFSIFIYFLSYFSSSRRCDGGLWVFGELFGTTARGMVGAWLPPFGGDFSWEERQRPPPGQPDRCRLWWGSVGGGQRGTRHDIIVYWGRDYKSRRAEYFENRFDKFEKMSNLKWAYSNTIFLTIFSVPEINSIK